jgi:hypothetical protein
MANDNITAAISSLQEDLDISNQYGKDASEGTEVAKTIENIEIKRNEQGRWEKTVTDQNFPAKKDVTARADELAFYEKNVSNLTTVAANADSKLYDTTNKINNQKQLIILTIASAVTAGCSCVIGNAVVNGVTIGIGSDVYTDYASVNEYSNLTSNSQNPFGSDVERELTPARLGTGYKTQFEINSSKGTNVGIYRTVNGLTAFNLPSTTCAAYKTTIDNAATEIASLRGSISNQLISDTNSIKDKKTEFELFAWSYRNTDKVNQQQKEDTQNVQSIIESQAGFQ